MRVCLPLLLALLPFGAWAKRPVTLDDVLAPHESAAVEPVWSPDGRSFVYQKHSVVYRYTLGSSKPSRWLDLASLDKSESTHEDTPAPFDWVNRHVSHNQFQWMPNSKDIVLSHGDDLFFLRAGGGKERLPLPQPAEDAILSPDGKSVLFRARHNLYVFDLQSRQSRQLTNDGSGTLRNGELDWVYPEELEIGTAAWWSPDSRQIAYLQFNIADEISYPQADLLGVRSVAEPERYPQAGTPNATVRLGIVSAQGGSTTWMQLPSGPDILLARVSWLPDSSRIAAEVLPRVQNQLDLFFCDPQSGAARNVIHEQPKTWINTADNLTFLAGGREFLWTSERSGFRHIYRYSENGEPLGQLTSGPWEVKSVLGVNEAAKQVFYAASEDSPLETHLYVVSLAGGKRSRITTAGFDHRIGMAPSGSAFLDESQNLTTPPETTVRDAAGSTVASLVERDSSAQRDFDLQPPEIVKVAAEDGTELYGKLVKPLHYQPGRRYPVIVRVYGGPGAQSVRNDWAGAGLDQVYAANGFVVWALDNRGSAGRGHAFEEPIYHNLGSVEVADQRAGVQYLVKTGIADPARVAITGWSYGGYMTLRCLLHAPDTFKLGVAGAPVTDWHNYDTIYTERYMGIPAHNETGYAQSSNVKAAARLKGQLLIQHNLEDDNVLFQNTMQMVNAFDRENRPYFLQLYGQKTHGVGGQERRLLYQSSLDFFLRNL